MKFGPVIRLAVLPWPARHAYGSGGDPAPRMRPPQCLFTRQAGARALEPKPLELIPCAYFDGTGALSGTFNTASRNLLWWHQTSLSPYSPDLQWS